MGATVEGTSVSEPEVAPSERVGVCGRAMMLLGRGVRSLAFGVGDSDLLRETSSKIVDRKSVV